MTATPYRRHSADCPHRANAQYKKCRCPMWLYVTTDGREIRKSLKTRSWEVAAKKALEIDAEQRVDLHRGAPVGIGTACELFRTDAQARGLSAGTLKKYRVLCEQLEAWCKAAGIHSPYQLTLVDLQKFRASWKDAPMSAAKKLERLRTLCGFLHAHGWIRQNFAKAIKPPKVDDAPTLPYTQDEVVALFAACERLGGNGALGAARMRALLLVLRYLGLRISDAVRLRVDAIKGGTLILRMQKTRVPVTLPVPAFVAAALEPIAQPNGYYFTTGRSKVTTDTGNWRRRFRRLAKLAGVVDAHPHRFRDTFAVELLQAGVSIYDVSTLLGHSSVKITERSYAPWIEERRIRLERVMLDAIQGPPTARNFVAQPIKTIDTM